MLHEFVEPARANVPPETWDYLMGGAETETTLQRNRMAIDELALRPRVLRDVENVDLTGKFFGHDWRLPVLLAPIGSLQDITKGGGIAPMRAAAKFGAAHMLSISCSPAGLQSFLEENESDPDTGYSVHLWQHTWWEQERQDFSKCHAGLFTLQYLRETDSPFCRLARPFLPDIELSSLDGLPA